MFGVLSGGASEQAPRSSAAPYPSMKLHFFIFALLTASIPARRRRTGEAHRGAGADSIGRIFDHAVVRREARRDFDDRTQVACDGHRLEKDAVAGVDGRN